MQRSSLPPPHPSLPRNPNVSVVPQPEVQVQPSTQYTNHHHFPTYYNSHYAQAYMQLPSSQTNPATVLRHASYNTGHSRNTPQYAMNSWYEPGHNRCSYTGCSFSGSHKSVELHMMDRHLIYPPGWEKREKQNTWDADPSLKGKPIPIQGTSIVLDSPDVLKAWIAERKRRFPTSSRVEEKERKISEAMARGQLDLTTSGRAPKRRKMETRNNNSREHTRQDYSFGRDQEQRLTKRTHITKNTITDLNVNPNNRSPCPSVSDDDDGEPETMSSKALPTVTRLDSEASREPEPMVTQSTSAVPSNAKLGSRARTQPPQPKLPPRNPFASRPTLLRNLLLPEIRITISNLSQAIHFLVDNNFLQYVELTAGQATEANMIEVVEDEAPCI